MTDNNTDAKKANGQDTQQGGQFNIQKLYLKDVSFETPNSPKIFQEQGAFKPEMEMAVNVDNVGQNLYECTLKVTVTSKFGEQTGYLIEVQQAGIFMLANFEQNQLAYMLNSLCPGVLYPYAREAISDIVMKGGFPPMVLTPINFDMVYAQQVQKKQVEQQANAEHNPPPTLQ